MSSAVFISVLTLVAALLIMGGETLLSAFNERLLRARGAVEPAGDVYAAMRWAYPAAFVAMAIEGAWGWGVGPSSLLVPGLALFGFAKALKIWAITTLGWRWSFRVLVLPGETLVASGPYRVIRHPNYVAVIGELLGILLIVHAPITGLLSLAGFSVLLARRIRVEDRALGRQ